MDFGVVCENKNELKYENEITKKIVWKILNTVNEKEVLSPDRAEYNRYFDLCRIASHEHLSFPIFRNKIVNFFAEAELLFKYHDMNKSGELDIQLFPQMARQLKQIYDPRDITKFKKEMHIKKIKKMNLPIFLTLLKRRLFQVIDADSVFQKHFEILDMNKENKIELETLKTYLSLVGDKINLENFNFFLNYNITKNGMLKEGVDDILLSDQKKPTHISLDAYREMLTLFKFL
ncbi:conserved Plasmodium protein, unknown function [Plasmodium ovale wallikeri]|uniref:EF-hand domain-containing protein n=1 Tax=Plasmodium ovale wallikeri TaxID=864142 RepID=A0A1A8YGL4_PLAOA|nr:conserved Plasmodium protein, unknown function [Plasmodium ovale wallikeri]